MNVQTHRLIIDHALERLLVEHSFSQLDIANKFKQLDIKIGRASISNLRNQKKTISTALLKRAAEGLEIIMERELCLTFKAEPPYFFKKENCKPQPIISPAQNKQDAMVLKARNYILHDGRRDVHEKVKLYQQANTEVIEIGIRLKNFRSYFEEKRESAFLNPLQELLARGVNFKCYNLATDISLARYYLEDRAEVQASENDLLKEIPKITRELKYLFQSINKENRAGKMELYQYEHFPYYHATVIDGNTENGQINIAPYLYGISRANTPVLAINRKANKQLYKKYWRSIKSFLQSRKVKSML